ncbi:MAG: hypothetical protein GQ544_06400 [Candidatus Aminicenantes bacterium]|nr:hypothetical protein [Candidatus Aminicenantes bacterium]
MERKTVIKAERAWFLDRKGEESEAGRRVRFPRWGNVFSGHTPIPKIDKIRVERDGCALFGRILLLTAKSI